MDELNLKRKEIDTIDDQIMSLLDKRFVLSKDIGTIKKTQKLTVLDSSRESIIYDKIFNYSHFPQLTNIYKAIMKESKSLQRK